MKRLIGKIILVAVLSVMPLLAYNIILDPYSVLRKDYSSLWLCPNERFVKTDYILRNPARYDSFVFGSSRVSQIPVRTLNTAAGGNFYNMTFISGVVAESLSVIKLFIKNKIMIKNIVIGIDYLSFQIPPPTTMRAILYPETLKEKINFYYKYLTLEPDSSMLAEVKFDGKDAAYDLAGTGEYDFVKKEKNLKIHPEQHDARFKGPMITICQSRLEDTLKETREIIDICRQNNIKLVVFMNPGHAYSYLCDDITFLNTVRERLAGMTDYWDFSPCSSITKNNFNFYDIIHYRKHIGDLVVKKIFNLKNDAPMDFGTFVTRSNVSAYLKKASLDYAAEKKKKPVPCLPCTK